MKIDILRYGVEEALARWKLDIERMHTEDWWPPVARAVEAVINEAFEARARQQQEERNRPSTPLITVSQTQSNREEKIDNRFEPGSNGQVFNGNVEGEFKK